MKKIMALNGQEASVSDDDFELVSQFRWSASRKKSGKGGYYFLTKKDRKTLYMHRLVMGAVAGQEIDHINGDPSDNRRENLRFCTRGQNSANRSYSPKSGFRGVYKQPYGNTWQVKICANRKFIRGGNFRDPIEAAKKYDELAVELFGQFATLNFPTETVL